MQHTKETFFRCQVDPEVHLVVEMMTSEAQYSSSYDEPSNLGESPSAILSDVVAPL